MSSWLTDDPTGVYFTLAALAILCLFGFVYTRRVIYLAGVGGMALLAAGVFWLDYLVITDREQVALNTEKLTDAVNRKDVEGFGQFISKEFYTDGVRRDTLMQRAREVFPSLRTVTLRVNEIKAETGGRVLVCHCTGSATGTVSSYELAGQPYLITFTYVKDGDGQWRIRKFEVWDVTGRQRFYPSQR
jgi:hypothetical protein